MAYTPPAGNAVNFVFAGAPYTPPGGNAVNFVFGGSIPPPPPGSKALPLGNFLNRFFGDDDEIPFIQREFAAPASAPVAAIFPYKRGWFVQPEDEEDGRWLRRRQFMVTVLDDDITVQFIM